MSGLLALAFAAGLLAPVNPCGFALLPAWFTYTIGDPDESPVPVRLARSLRAGLALTLGFAGTLTAVGITVSAGARALIGAAPWLGLAIGVALVLIGAVMLGGRTLGLRLPTARQPTKGSAHGTGRMIAFGAGYAAASLSCTFGVLLAVIAQAQATATFTGLLAVFAAYALGSATILLLVAITSAAAGAVLVRRVTALARHSNQITAVVLLVTGTYLAWYWYPAATGDRSRTTGLADATATAATWLQEHTTAVTLFAGAVVLTVAVVALAHHLRAPGRQAARTRPAPSDAAPSHAVPADCCTPDTDPDDPPAQHQTGAPGTGHP
ncbi:cytochrome c biogenesis CcdA family protein [Promicromonospora sp. NPDC023987]|uniref:cytochrome c biogenesis CcdA family protein n=1 Tax=Promicromonospora sp. NPDC023987 TaxID=3155360 RepID=UPI0033CB1E68